MTCTMTLSTSCAHLALLYLAPLSWLADSLPFTAVRAERSILSLDQFVNTSDIVQE